jgi:hypothetical protein
MMWREIKNIGFVANERKSARGKYEPGKYEGAGFVRCRVVREAILQNEDVGRQ